MFSRTLMPRDQLALEAGQAALPSGLLALGNAQLTLPMTRPRSRSPRRYSGRGAGGSLHGGSDFPWRGGSETTDGKYQIFVWINGDSYYLLFTYSYCLLLILTLEASRKRST